MNKKSLVSLSIVTAFVVFFGFLILRSKEGAPLPKKSVESGINRVKIAGQIVKIDLANTKETRVQGLSGRISLKDDEGMLFVFENEGKHPFWMKNMNFPIDIIWINEKKVVVEIVKDASPESYPNILGGIENSKYVLEVSSKFSEKNNLRIGDSVEFLP